MKSALNIHKDFQDIKGKGYNLFYEGKVTEAFKVLEDELLVKAKESDNYLNSIYAYLAISRLKMEIGQYNHADLHLEEIEKVLRDKEQEIISSNDYTLTSLACKYWHLQVKNLMRGYYYQKSQEKLDQGFEVIKKIENEYLRDKYTCKMHENQANLHCEPLCFTKAEQNLEQAEEIYKNKKLSKDLYFRFKIKLGAFKKKYGFFDMGAEYLAKFEEELLQSEKELSERQFLKLQFKINRDLARIFALKRNKDKANTHHNKAQEFLKKIYPQVKSNIKIAKLQLIKGIWMGKFDMEKAIFNLRSAFQQFQVVIGSDKNYFGANCLLEIGNFHTRLKEYQKATAFLSMGNEILEEVFYDDHPIIQKYLSYSAEIASAAEDKEMMISVTDKLCDLVDYHNKKNNGEKSIFYLDALLTKVSILCQTTGKEEELDKTISEMEEISTLNGALDLSQLVLSAYTMKSIELIRKERHNEALELLERTIEKMLKLLKNEKQHPFLEQIHSQMGMLLKATGNYSRAEEVYGNLVLTKQKYYGEEFEGLITPLKHLGQSQFLLNKEQLAMETFDRALKLGEKILQNKPPSERKNTLPIVQDLHFTIYSIHLSKMDYMQAMENVKKYVEITKELYGEKTNQYSYALFLQVKLMVLIPNTDSQEKLNLVNQAISIEENLQAAKPIKSALLGRIYYVKATTEFGDKEFNGARKSYKRALEILRSYQEFADIEPELQRQIQTCEAQGASSDDEQATEKESQVDSSISPIAVGAITALAVGAAVFGFLRYQNK